MMLCGFSPFLGENDAEVFLEITSGEIVFVEEEWEHVGHPARDLVQKMLSRDPE